MKPIQFTLLLIALSTLLVSSIGLAAYTETEVVDGGSIKGKLSFAGPLPENAVEKIAITKNPEVCGDGYREVVWIDVKDSALRGAFVFIDKIKQGKAWPAPAGGAYMIEQKSCRFSPRAQVIQRGSITIRNSDEGVLHNINMREMIGIEKGRVVKRTLFNFGQPDPGDIVKKVKPRRSPFISINCEAHNFMFGFMLAPEHPYAVVVDEAGNFSIDNIPPGTYQLKAWHPMIGLQTTEVTVAAGEVLESDFSFSTADSE